MKVVLFILSMTDASFSVMATPNGGLMEWEVPASCQQFIETELIREDGFIYQCDWMETENE